MFLASVCALRTLNLASKSHFAGEQKPRKQTDKQADRQEKKTNKRINKQIS